MPSSNETNGTISSTKGMSTVSASSGSSGSRRPTPLVCIRVTSSRSFPRFGLPVSSSRGTTPVTRPSTGPAICKTESSTACGSATASTRRMHATCSPSSCQTRISPSSSLGVISRRMNREEPLSAAACSRLMTPSILSRYTPSPGPRRPASSRTSRGARRRGLRSQTLPGLHSRSCAKSESERTRRAPVTPWGPLTRPTSLKPKVAGSLWSSCAASG
mmetsp:Transcript_15790/g.47909  ORF Transcript_15790/g.47909 Transcript_15790/m.47909 type:complete len:217 (-) Transcript_15790:96-746(-)